MMDKRFRRRSLNLERDRTVTVIPFGMELRVSPLPSGRVAFIDISASVAPTLPLYRQLTGFGNKIVMRGSKCGNRAESPLF